MGVSQSVPTEIKYGLVYVILRYIQKSRFIQAQSGGCYYDDLKSRPRGLHSTRAAAYCIIHAYALAANNSIKRLTCQYLSKAGTSQKLLTSPNATLTTFSCYSVFSHTSSPTITYLFKYRDNRKSVTLFKVSGNEILGRSRNLV